MVEFDWCSRQQIIVITFLITPFKKGLIIHFNLISASFHAEYFLACFFISSAVFL